jgi:predicted NBD/HSP70 family sugar kinase
MLNEEERTHVSNKPSLPLGVNVGLNSIHMLIVREEADSKLRLMGEHRNRRFKAHRDKESLVQRVLDSIEQAIKDARVDQKDILTIGVATPGQIDIDHGVVLFSPLFHILRKEPFPLASKLQEHFPAQHITLINNDDAPGIAEQRLGEGKDIPDVVYLRVGYSIGACIIIDGKLYTGMNNLAGAVGHMIADLDGPKCRNCGNRGCLDVLASRGAIEQNIVQRYRAGEESILAKSLDKQSPDINSAVLAEAIEEEDTLTCQVVEKAAEVLGAGIANLIDLMNPHKVILGGDVVDEIDLFFEKAKASACKASLVSSSEGVSIVRGRLGATAGAYGAMVFAKERYYAQPTSYSLPRFSLASLAKREPEHH